MKKDPVYIDIGDYNFCIRPFSAFDGGYAALFVTIKLLPIVKTLANKSDEQSGESDAANKLLDIEINDKTGVEWDQIVDAIIPILNGIDRKELNEFMELCLSQIDIRMKAGYMPLYKHGIFADDDIGCSTMICFRLCFEAIKPLVSDFFAENGLNLSRVFSAITSQSAQ